MRRLLFSALVCGSLLPASVRAQPTSAVRIGATRSMSPLAVAITREEVELDCLPPDGDDRAMPCDLRIRITLANAESELVAAPLLFTVERADGLTIGEPGTVSATAVPVLRPLTFPIPSGGERTLELHGSIELRRADTGMTGVTDALAARHPLVATATTGTERSFVYARPVAGHFTSVPEEITVRVRVPEGHYLDTRGAGWSVEGTPRDRVATVRMPRDSRVVDLPISIRSGAPELDIIRNGGPFLAFGAAIGDGRPTTFRGRVGYEIGFIDWIIVGVSAETDFARVVEVAVMLEAASPSMVFPPSFSVGVGLPIRVWSDPAAMPAATSPTAGIRVAGGLTFLAIGFEALFDYWPTDNAWSLGLLGRIGL